MALAFPFFALILFCLTGPWRLEPSFLLQLATVAGSAVIQALASAGVSLALGLAGAGGLFWASVRSPGAATALRLTALAPCAFPPLAAILTWLTIAPGVRGFAAIVGTHALLNSGLAAVAIEQAARAKVGGMVELALAEGASRMDFFRRGAWPLLKGDLCSIGLFVFAVCFVSFAVPLTLGGVRAATLEVVIFERARIAGDLPGALAAALVQTLFVFAAAFLLRGPVPFSAAPSRARFDLLSWCPGLAVAVLPFAALAGALVPGAFAGAGALMADASLRADLARLMAGSATAAVACGLSCVLVWMTIAFARPSGLARRALVGYAAPSATLTGLALLLTLPGGPGWGLAKIALGCALLAAPALHRLRWDQCMEDLAGQVTAARALGAGPGLIFARVTLPQLWRPAFWLGGLAAFWAWGDFALSSIVTERRSTIAMSAAALMDSYRLDAASALVVLTLIGGAATLALFWGVGHVGRA